jgi:hypothetical protein
VLWQNKLLSMDNIDKKYKLPMTICCFGIHDKSMEIRYQYNMDKHPRITRRTQYSGLKHVGNVAKQHVPKKNHAEHADGKR